MHGPMCAESQCMGLCALSLGAWAYVLSESQCMGLFALSLGAWAYVLSESQ